MKNLLKSKPPLADRNSERRNDSKHLKNKNKTTTHFAKATDPEFGTHENGQDEVNNVNLTAKAEEASPRPNDGTEEMKHLRVRILQLIGRVDKLGEQIDFVYAGRPFLPDMGPTVPANRRGFNGYLLQLRKQTRLLLNALTLWRIYYGVGTDELFACEKLPRPRRTSVCKGMPQASNSTSGGFTKRSH